MSRHTVNLIILLVGAVLLGSLMVSCGHGGYQPPGGDIPWQQL